MAMGNKSSVSAVVINQNRPVDYDRFAKRRAEFFTTRHEDALRERNARHAEIVRDLVKQSDERVEKFLHSLEKQLVVKQ